MEFGRERYNNKSEKSGQEMHGESAEEERVRDGERAMDEVNERVIRWRTVWQKDTVHHAPCLAVKRGRTKFNQDLSPVSSHWNKA